MADDGKSDIKGSTHKNVPEGILEELDIKEPGPDKDAEEACPVSCIHIKSDTEPLGEKRGTTTTCGASRTPT